MHICLSMQIGMKKYLSIRTWILLSLCLGFLSACNLPNENQETTPTLSVTQAYQTVQARLTQAVTRTPGATRTPVPTDSGLPTPTDTQAAAVNTATVPAATNTATANDCDKAAPGVPIDVTIPDDTRMQPNHTFTKVWRLRNVGTCTWGPDYRVQFFSGEIMGAPRSVSLPDAVDPGDNVDIAVEMVAPKEAGIHQGNWKLQNANGEWFGIGPNGNSPFWVRIEVVPLPTNTPTAVLETVTPSPTPTQAIQVQGTVTLPVGDRFDLDKNQINPGSGEDLTYEVNDQGQYLLVALKPARLGVFGEEQPDMADCQEVSLEVEALDAQELAAGTYICYRTNLGLPGWLLFSGLDSEQPEQITLEFLTYSLP